MISDARATELFATWTTFFTVEVDRAAGHLKFSPASVEGLYLRPKNLFARPGTSEGRYHGLISAFLSLQDDSPDVEWQRVAQLLGPLLAHHPLQHAYVENEAPPS